MTPLATWRGLTRKRHPWCERSSGRLLQSSRGEQVVSPGDGSRDWSGGRGRQRRFNSYTFRNDRDRECLGLGMRKGQNEGWLFCLLGVGEAVGHFLRQRTVGEGEYLMGELGRWEGGDLGNVKCLEVWCIGVWGWHFFQSYIIPFKFYCTPTMNPKSSFRKMFTIKLSQLTTLTEKSVPFHGSLNFAFCFL